MTGNGESQGKWGVGGNTFQLHLFKLLRLTQSVGHEGLGAGGDEVDGESEDAQLQDTHVILAQVRGVVYSDPRGVIQTWGRQDRSEEAGERATGCGERGLGRQGWGCEQESVGLLHQCLEDSASPIHGRFHNRSRHLPGRL